MSQKPKTQPVVAKGLTFPFPVAVVSWVDLLGYGSMIADADYNPLHPSAKKARDRLRQFHDIVASSSARRFPTLVINDGAVAYRDLSLRSRSVTHDFLSRSWKLYCRLNDAEEAAGHPGARLVIASGFRVREDHSNAATGHTESILRRFTAGRIGATQAIREAARSRPHSDAVPELQANFAFTKAYVAESSGRKGGLPGPGFYLDLSLISNPSPPWLELGPLISWRNNKAKLSADFKQLLGIKPYAHPEGGPTDICDGLEVSQKLAGDPDVLVSLRAAAKSS